MTQRYLATYTMSETGYLIAQSLGPVDDDRPMRYDWKGAGDGSGELIVMGSEHYIATWVNLLQHSPIFRYATRAVGVDKGQLDLGIVGVEPSPCERSHDD